MLFTFDDFELDLRQCELRRSGETCHLEPQVFDVLAYLVRNRDRLVTKQELLEQVWGHGFVTESTLSSRLMGARKAVGDNGREQRIIRTLHGRGFRFVAAVREIGAPGEPGAASIEVGGTAVAKLARGGRGERKLIPARSDAVPPVGRDGELGLLEALLEEALAGARRIAFVTGEPGIGKTTLIDAFARAAAVRGVAWIAFGHCVDQRGAGEPYMPILEALGRCCRQPGAGDLVELLERRAPTWLAQMPGIVGPETLVALEGRIRGATRERMLREMVEALEAWTASAPLLLLLEDLHWSDPSTLQLVDWLARRREAARLMVVASLRTTAAGPEARRLRTLVRELQVAGLATEIPLSLLDVDSTREYLRARIPGATVGRELAESIHAQTEGNPLFLRTLLDARLADGAIRDVGGEWRLDEQRGEATEAVPHDLQRLVDQQVDALEPHERNVVETASVLGMEFAAATLAFDAPLEAVERVCEALARGGRFFRDTELEEWPDGTVSTRYAFIHHLQREAVYSRIPEGRRARLHRQAAIRLEEAYGAGSRPRANELALHFLAGRSYEKAVVYLHRVAEQCVDRAAYPEAIRHLERALTVVREHLSEPARRPDEARLLLLLGTVLVLQRGWADPRAIAALRQARALAEDEGGSGNLGTILCALATVHEVRGEFRTSQQLVEQCLRLERLTDQPGIESYDLLACSLMHQGLFHDALQRADEGSERFGAADSPAWVGTDGSNPGVACLYWGALSLWFLGRPAASLERMRAALRLAESFERPYLRISPETYAARLYQHRRDPEEVLRRATTAAALAPQHGYAYHEAMADILAGWAHAMLGRVETGVGMVRRGLAMHDESGAALDRPYVLGILAEVLCRAGDDTGARDALEEGLRQVGQHARSFFWEAELHRMLGEILARTGARAEALERLERAVSVAAAQGARPLEMRAALSLLRLRKG